MRRLRSLPWSPEIFGEAGRFDLERVMLFDLLHVVASGYAVVRGGAPERVAGAALLLASLVTRITQSQTAAAFAGADWIVFGVNVTLLAILLAVALDADRYWPLALAALQGLGTTALLEQLLDLKSLPPANAGLAAIWSYPMPALLFWGTIRHRLRRRRIGTDRAWSRSLLS